MLQWTDCVGRNLVSALGEAADVELAGIVPVRVAPRGIRAPLDLPVGAGRGWVRLPD
jgi:hypothetical protein